MSAYELSLDVRLLYPASDALLADLSQLEGIQSVTRSGDGVAIDILADGATVTEALAGATGGVQELIDGGSDGQGIVVGAVILSVDEAERRRATHPASRSTAPPVDIVKLVGTAANFIPSPLARNAVRAVRWYATRPKP